MQAPMLANHAHANLKLPRYFCYSCLYSKSAVYELVQATAGLQSAAGASAAHSVPVSRAQKCSFVRYSNLKSACMLFLAITHLAGLMLASFDQIFFTVLQSPGAPAYVIFDVYVKALVPCASSSSFVVCLYLAMDHDAGLDERYSRLWLPPMAEA